MPNGKKYEVVIRATVTKTMCVKAENADAATEVAHELFSAGCTGDDEHYEQDTIGEVLEVNK